GRRRARPAGRLSDGRKRAVLAGVTQQGFHHGIDSSHIPRLSPACPDSRRQALWFPGGGAARIAPELRGAWPASHHQRLSMEIIVACLLLYVGCIVFIRLRNKSTFPLKRQLTDFSTFMVPFNIPAYLLSKVPTTPRVSKEYFPELKIIEDNWETIRDEALALYTGGQITAKEDLPASSFYKDNRWTSFYLKLYDNRIPSAWELAPKTMAILDQVPSLNLALFAVLMPGKRLNKHHDPFAYTLRYSLGLSTPNSDGSGLIVNDEDYK